MGLVELLELDINEGLYCILLLDSVNVGRVCLLALQTVGINKFCLKNEGYKLKSSISVLEFKLIFNLSFLPIPDLKMDFNSLIEGLWNAMFPRLIGITYFDILRSKFLVGMSFPNSELPISNFEFRDGLQELQISGMTN